MIGDNALFDIGEDGALLLGTGDDGLKGYQQILLVHRLPAHTDGTEGGFVHQVCKIGTYGTGGDLGNAVEVHILGELDILGMHLQSLETACQVGLIHNDPAVKPSCTEQRLVQNFRTVGGGEDHNALGGIEAVDLGEQLVQGLFPFVVAAQTAVTALTDGVDLIDEDDRGSLLCGLLEQVAHTACANAHEHLDKIRTGDEEERDTCFTGYCLSQ